MVRMGVTPKAWKTRAKEEATREQNAVGRETKKTKSNKRRQYKASILHVGRVYPNLVESVYHPIMLDLAEKSSETYASYLLWKADDESVDATTTTEEQEDDDVVSSAESSPFPDPIAYGAKVHLFPDRAAMDEFVNTVLKSTARDHGSNKRYKVLANAAKFERGLDEKYGRFRPLFTHPKVEHYVKILQRKVAMGQLGQITRTGDAPIGKTSSIMLLFMMYRGGTRKDAVLLTGLFLLVGLQPWVLVIGVCLVRSFLRKKRRSPIKGMKSNMCKTVTPYYHTEAVKSDNDNDTDNDTRNQLLHEPVGELYSTNSSLQNNEDSYHTIIIGTGPPALYCAALLSRVGRKVLVLSQRRDDASGDLTLNPSISYYSNTTTKKPLPTHIPFDISESKVGLVAKQQRLLAPALATTTDCQGGVRFVSIGSVADGYAHDIVSVGEGSEPFVLRSAAGLAEDTALYLGDSWDATSNAAAAYVTLACEVNKDAGPFYMAKLAVRPPNYGNNNKQKSTNTYANTGSRYASDFLKHWIPNSPHVRSLCAGIGLTCEDLPPHKTSMAAHVSNLAAFKDGFSYPVGGYRALCKALENVVVKNGGRVLRGVELQHLVFEDDGTKAQPNTDGKPHTKPGPKCLGVKLADGITVLAHTDDATIDPAVVVTNGFVDAFLMLMSEEVRAKGSVPHGLPALAERRPQLKLLLLLHGNRSKLELSGADWWRLPNATVSDTAPVVAAPEPTAVTDETEQAKPTTPTKTPSHKFMSGKSWMRVSFPSAKDPSWEEVYGSELSTCVVTVEADDDFVKNFHTTTPKLFVPLRGSENSKGKRLVDRIMRDVYEEFPQLKNNIAHMELRGPIRKGLSHTPERYVVKGIVPNTNYPNLYIGGSDLCMDNFSGEIVGSWMATNAVLKYGHMDLSMLQKNVTADLQYLLEEPDSEEEAVLYTTTEETTELENAVNVEAIEDKDSGMVDEAITAETSKES